MQPLGILIQAHACIRLPLVEVGGQFNSSFVRVYFTVCIAMHRDEMHVEPFLPHITLQCIELDIGADRCNFPGLEAIPFCGRFEGWPPQFKKLPTTDFWFQFSTFARLDVTPLRIYGINVHILRRPENAIWLMANWCKVCRNGWARVSPYCHHTDWAPSDQKAGKTKSRGSKGQHVEGGAPDF